MAEETVNGEKSSAANTKPASTSLVPRSVHLSEAPWFEGSANGESHYQRETGSKIREWWRLIYRHKVLILSLVLLIVPFLTIRAYREKPIYEAMTTIEVRMETSAVLAKWEVNLFYGGYDNTKSEAFIIKSRPVLERVVNKLKLDQNPRFLDSTKRRTVWEALRAVGGVNIEDEKKKLQEAAKPTVLPAEELAATVNDNQAAPPGEREKLTPYINLLYRNLRVEPMKDTRLLKIVYSHPDPEIAATVANEIAESFRSYNFDTKTQRFDDAVDYLGDSTRKLKAMVEQAEKKLTDYQRSHEIYSADPKEDLATNKLAEMHTQVMKAETDRIIKESLYEQVKQGRVNQLPEAFSDPKTAELRKELNGMAVTVAQLKVKFGPKHPRIVEIREQMTVIQEQIDNNRVMLEERLKADYERAVREEQSLKNALDQAKSEATNQNQANIQFSILQQDLNTAKTLYNDFLNKSNQASIQRAEQYNNVRLIESAEPPRFPVGPNRHTSILVGLIASLLLGVGLAYLIENLNTSIRNIDDVSRITPLPTLAVIPRLEQNALQKQAKTGVELLESRSDAEVALLPAADLAQSFMNDEYSTAAEAYRMLRTSVLLSTAGHPPKTILVTSGQPGDGKTTTVFNTAVAFTQLKSEVLIIDCDMRKPRLHKVAQINKGMGLSNYLSSGTGLDELIQPTAVPHLSILPCGPIPPNPSELISSDKMKELLAELADRYDYIVVDSPPLVTVTDPMILSTLVDGVILVAKSGRTKTEVLRRAYQDLATINAKILGVVLNDFNLRRDGYQNYYYYYRYQYDYRENGNGTKA